MKTSPSNIGLDIEEKAALKQGGLPALITTGAELKADTDITYWKTGDVLTLGVQWYGVTVKRGRPGRELVENRLTELQDWRNAYLRDQEFLVQHIPPHLAYDITMDLAALPANASNAAIAAVFTGYRDEMETVITLSSLGAEMGLTSQRSSSLHLNAAFYPAHVRCTGPTRTFEHYDVARRWSEGDLDNALELLEKGDQLVLLIDKFRDYCAGTFFRGLWPSEEPVPGWLKAWIPQGKEVYIEVTVKLAQEEQNDDG